MNVGILMWRRTRPFDMASALEVFSLALNENGKVFIVPMESGCITGSQPTCAFDEACRCCSVLVIPGNHIGLTMHRSLLAGVLRHA